MTARGWFRLPATTVDNWIRPDYLDRPGVERTTCVRLGNSPRFVVGVVASDDSVLSDIEAKPGASRIGLDKTHQTAKGQGRAFGETVSKSVMENLI